MAKPLLSCFVWQGAIFKVLMIMEYIQIAAQKQGKKNKGRTRGEFMLLSVIVS